MRTVAFRALGLAASFLVRAARVCESLAVAVLPRAELTAAVARVWEKFNLSPVALDEKLFDWEETTIARLVRPGACVLVVGCGAGREVIALLRLGLAVDGLDIAPQAVARARERVRAAGFESRLQVAAIEDGPDLPQYDLVLFSWFCFSYIPGRDHRRRALSTALRALRPGGHVMLSYILGRPGGAHRATRLAAFVTRLAGSGWRPEPGDELLLPGGPGLASFQRLYQPAEILAEVEAGGLKVTRHELVEDVGVVVAAAPPAEGSSTVTLATSAVDSVTGGP